MVSHSVDQAGQCLYQLIFFLLLFLALIDKKSYQVFQMYSNYDCMIHIYKLQLYLRNSLKFVYKILSSLKNGEGKANMMMHAWLAQNSKGGGRKICSKSPTIIESLRPI